MGFRYSFPQKCVNFCLITSAITLQMFEGRLSLLKTISMFVFSADGGCKQVKKIDYFQLEMKQFSP